MTSQVDQNLEDQYFKKFGFPMIFCNIHQQCNIEFININHQNENKLACTQCLIQDKLNSEFLVSIQDIFIKNPSNVKNWPPLSDQTNLQKLFTNDIQESKISQSIQQIKQYFSQLQTNIQIIIEDHLKKILVQINSIEENRQSAVDVYNKISENDIIKEQFQKNKNNLKQLEEYLNKLITSKQTQSIPNQQKINNAIDIFTKSQQKFQFGYIDNLFQQFQMDLKQIDLLNPLLTKDQQFQSRIKDEKKKQDEENKLNQKIDKVMSLINNKSNFCNQKFLNNMKDILIMNKQIFTQIDLEDCFIEESVPIQFEYLSYNELQQLSYIINYTNNQKVNKKNDQIKESNKNPSIFEQSVITTQYLLKQNENNIIEEMKQNNSQNTQIIENKINLLQRVLNEICLLQKW